MLNSNARTNMQTQSEPTWCVFPLTTGICPIDFDRLSKTANKSKEITTQANNYFKCHGEPLKVYIQVPSIKRQYSNGSWSPIKVMNESIGWLHFRKPPKTSISWGKNLAKWEQHNYKKWKLPGTFSFLTSLHPSIGPVLEKTSWRRGSVTCVWMFPTYLHFLKI